MGGVGIPQWVSVWWWLRMARGDFRTLPQQDAPSQMTLAEYETCRDEWFAAGAPKMTAGKFIRTFEL